MEKYLERYQTWLTGEFFDQETKQELEAIRDDDNEIRERFSVDLEFGTAGLRGIIGAGTNRMNKYVVRRATQGIANYILGLDKNAASLKDGKTGAERGVVIAYDSRHMSKEFSDEVARCLAANGIKAYRFESLRPTPELSFSVRELGCIAGINVTASHNPSNYNGYKVYWEDGAQITPPHDTGIMKEVLAIEDFSTCRTMPAEEAKAAGLYVTVGKELDEKFIACVESTILNKDLIREMADETTIVYTPLNGTGHVPVMRVMKDLGFRKVYEVPEQAEPDGNFPTTPSPNPEAAETFTLALKLAKEKDADLVLATDPDADRLGIYVKDALGNRQPNVTMDMPYPEVTKRVRGAIEDYFKLELGRPEILNRIGENIVVFDFIRREAGELILRSQVDKIIGKLRETRDIRVRIEDFAYDSLREAALFDLSNGGRGIGNQVESLLINPLSRWLFDNGITDNADVILEGFDVTANPPCVRCRLEGGEKHGA